MKLRSSFFGTSTLLTGRFTTTDHAVPVSPITTGRKSCLISSCKLAENEKCSNGFPSRMNGIPILPVVRWGGLAIPPRHTRGGAVHDEMDDPAPLERTDDRD